MRIIIWHTQLPKLALHLVNSEPRDRIHEQWSPEMRPVPTPDWLSRFKAWADP